MLDNIVRPIAPWRLPPVGVAQSSAARLQLEMEGI